MTVTVLILVGIVLPVTLAITWIAYSYVPYSNPEQYACMSLYHSVMKSYRQVCTC